MSPGERDRVRQFYYRATEIAALCEVIAAALADDPDTAMSGFAVDGVGKLATMLSNDVLAIAED